MSELSRKPSGDTGALLTTARAVRAPIRWPVARRIAANLEETGDTYQVYFEEGPANLDLTEDDVDGIIAYLRRLM